MEAAGRRMAVYLRHLPLPERARHELALSALADPAKDPAKPGPGRSQRHAHPAQPPGRADTGHPRRPRPGRQAQAHAARRDGSPPVGPHLPAPHEAGMEHGCVFLQLGVHGLPASCAAPGRAAAHGHATALTCFDKAGPRRRTTPKEGHETAN